MRRARTDHVRILQSPAGRVPERREPPSGTDLWLAAYFGLCFLATNGLAVGLKTLIVEELDYPTRVWFEAYLGPLHIYIVAVALSYLALIARNPTAALDWGLGLFVQLGLLAGYAVGVIRLLNEPMSLAAPTMGLSGVIMCGAFALYNFDLYQRFVAPASRLARQG